MSIPLHQVDAFTDCQYAGNPAGVCFPVGLADPVWMQAVATEVGVAETAFLVGHGGGAFDLRWFTPTTEVPLCGHATLAAAHVIWALGLEPDGTELTFATASGPLVARRSSDGWIELDFPATPPLPVAPDSERWHEAVALSVALGVAVKEAAALGRNWILLAATAQEVRAARPDFSAVAALGDMVVLTAPSDGVLPATATLPKGIAAANFVSRVFVPAWGIPEDPVTGSAHCALGPFWAPRLGRNEMVGFQASTRGGVVRVRVAGDRVVLGGQAVTTIVGQLSPPA
jgi:PhzF family phenazine biosynthesis protein